jgi:hypothetical protein
VGEALRNCAARVPAYFASQIMVGLFAAVLMIVVSGALIVLRVPAPIAAGAGIAAAVFPLLRTIMVGPVLGVGRTHSPIMAIRASLALTRGNTGRILAFLALAMLVYVVASSVVMMVVGLLSAQVLGAESESARLLNEAVSALLNAVGSTYFVAMLAGIHGQLTKDLPRPRCEICTTPAPVKERAFVRQQWNAAVPLFRRSVLPAPRDHARGHVDRLEPLVDAVEIAAHQRAGAGGVLIDQERAAGAQHALRGGHDRRPDPFGQRRERQARQHVVGVVIAMLADDAFHVGGRAVHRDEAAVTDGAGQIGDEIGVGVDHDQARIAAQAIEHRLAERAHAGAIFHEQVAAFPIHLGQHARDRAARGRHDRTHHHRVLDEPLEKMPAGPNIRSALRRTR